MRVEENTTFLDNAKGVFPKHATGNSLSLTNFFSPVLWRRHSYLCTTTLVTAIWVGLASFGSFIFVKWHFPFIHVSLKTTQIDLVIPKYESMRPFSGDFPTQFCGYLVAKLYPIEWHLIQAFSEPSRCAASNIGHGQNVQFSWQNAQRWSLSRKCN